MNKDLIKTILLLFMVIAMFAALIVEITTHNYLLANILLWTYVFLNGLLMTQRK